MGFLTPVGTLSHVRSRLRYADMGHLLWSQVVPLASSFLLTFATASSLGPSGRGTFSFVTATSNLVSQALGLSLFIGSATALRAGAVASARAAWRLTTAISAALALGGLVVRLAVGESAATIGWVGVLAALVMVQVFTGRTLQGIGRTHDFVRLSVLNALGSLTLGVLSAWLTRDPTAVLAAWGTATGTTALVGYVLVRPHLADRGEQPGPSAVRDSFAAHVGNLGQQLLLRADLPLLGALAPPAVVGLYAVASPLANVVFMFGETAALAAFARGVGEHVTASDHERRRIALTRTYLALTGGSGLCVIGASWLLLPLLLPEFTGALPLIVALMPGGIVQGYARIGLASLLSRGAHRATRIVGFSSAALTLGYVPAIALGGALGAALASSCLYCLQAVVVARILRGSRP